MYVRWQARQRTTGRKPSVHWAAVLVESVRVDGRPTQRHIGYLGGITKADVAGDLVRRIRFWEKATKQLDKLRTRMSTEERRRIESVLAGRVPRPTSRELRQHDRLRQQQQAPSHLDTEQRIMELELELEEEQELLA